MAQPKRKKDNYEELVKLIRQISPGNLQRLLEFAIGEFMEVELDEKIRAKSYERRKGRNNYRNGYRVRKELLKTGLGDLWLKIHKMKEGSYYPSILENYNRIDKALVTVICVAYYAGVSTRKMENIFYQIGMADIDRNVVSRCAQEIDDHVRIWKERTLDDNYVYIWLDAI
jgi:transposase-like protein